MLSLYEILKASKTGIAPDMWTALAGMNWGGADSGHEVKELTGIPPLSFTADGTPLLDYLISGNTVQNGTPTPSAPIAVQGVGELDSGQYKIPISNGQQTTNIYLGSTQTVRQVKKLVITGKEGWNQNTTSFGMRFFTQLMNSVSANTGVKRSLCTHYPLTYAGGTSAVANAYTIGSNGNVYISSDTLAGVVDFKAYLAAQYAAGTPVTIWYVLATPTTGIVNEPLMKIGDYADTLSMEQASVSIPTLNGNTVIDVLTDVKPSEMYIKYQK